MTGRNIVVAGATGLIGRCIVSGLLADPAVASVCTLSRRAPPVQNAKLKALVVDFSALPRLSQVDEVYLALGTTIKAAGSQAAFRAVDFDANLAVANAAIAAGARRAGLVSAMGADANSTVFYSRVKGELENTLIRMPFDGLVIARPSLLVGDRKALGQPVRPLEGIGSWVGSTLGFLIPRNWAPIDAAKVARALLSTVPSAQGVQTLLSGAMQ